MALDKDILGAALYSREQTYNDQAPDVLGDLAAARLDFWKAMADEIINHFKTYGQLATTGKGLTAGSNAVIGTSATNIIT